MERAEAIRELDQQIERLTIIQTSYRVGSSEVLERLRNNIRKLIAENRINVREELDPQFFYLYHRYFT